MTTSTTPTRRSISLPPVLPGMRSQGVVGGELMDDLRLPADRHHEALADWRSIIEGHTPLTLHPDHRELGIRTEIERGRRPDQWRSGLDLETRHPIGERVLVDEGAGVVAQIGRDRLGSAARGGGVARRGQRWRSRRSPPVRRPFRTRSS